LEFVDRGDRQEDATFQRLEIEQRRKPDRTCAVSIALRLVTGEKILELTEAASKDGWQGRQRELHSVLTALQLAEGKKGLKATEGVEDAICD
jgi:hypothetical protein